MWGLAFYSQVDSTYMNASFHQEREIWANKTNLTPPILVRVSVSNPESERSCICVKDIDLVFVYTFAIGFYKCSDSVVFFCFSLYYSPLFCSGFMLYLCYLYIYTGIQQDHCLTLKTRATLMEQELRKDHVFILGLIQCQVSNVW